LDEINPKQLPAKDLKFALKGALVNNSKPPITNSSNNNKSPITRKISRNNGEFQKIVVGSTSNDVPSIVNTQSFNN
jgi:hypothetical protein